MNRTERHIIIDVGNTSVKLAVFEGDKLEAVERDTGAAFVGRVAALSDQGIRSGILSSVATLPDELIGELRGLPLDLLWLNAETPLPFVNLYESPATLGPDRLAAAAGACALFPDSDVLVIDAGTCIKYEKISKGRYYHGGNISPGLTMRFEALHEFTARLPLLNGEGDCPDWGIDTPTAMRSGVINGIRHEMNGFIRQMVKTYPGLQVVITGGDAELLAPMLEYPVHRAPHLVLSGLNHILNYNLKPGDKGREEGGKAT